LDSLSINQISLTDGFAVDLPTPQILCQPKTMASPQDSRIVHEMGFAPLNPVDVSVGLVTEKLVPKIVSLMTVLQVYKAVSSKTPPPPIFGSPSTHLVLSLIQALPPRKFCVIVVKILQNVGWILPT
jgi:hypothetical protein